MLHMPKIRHLPELPLPSHPTHFHVLGPTKRLNPVGSWASATRQCSVKVPVYTQLPSAVQPPHPFQEGSRTFCIFFDVSCAAGYEVMALEGGSRTEHRFHNSNKDNQPKHPGNLSHLHSLGIRFAWPAREACMFNFINAINHPKDSVITFYALLTFMHCSA